MQELFSRKTTGLCVIFLCHVISVCLCVCCYSDEDEVMTSLDKIHNVGTFVQITELHDMGDQMRMIIQGYRR